MDCGAIYYPQKGRHVCANKKCKLCALRAPKDFNKHRCPLYVAAGKIEKSFIGDTITDFEKRDYELWVWDIESHFVLTDDTTNYYETNEDGTFKTNTLGLVVSKRAKLQQLPNYICAMNVFTNVKKEFITIKEFIDFFSRFNNGGKNLLLAHNSAGYDTRLVFDEIVLESGQDVTPICKGTKFMKLAIGKCIFHDTRLHLTGSLASLGKAFNLPSVKGHFPHLFSTLENLDYVGPIPDISFFDITFSCRNEKEFIDFNAWHEEWRTSNREWNYLEQRKLYCENDVLMLQQIVKQYHEGLLISIPPHIRVSPWFFPTMAGHVHAMFIHNMNYGQDLKNATSEQVSEYAKNHMCGLIPIEHYYARSALRGGMTNICQYIYEGKFHYQDIQSSYPSVQLDSGNIYPVGPPTIEYHHLAYFPCVKCPQAPFCHHPYSDRLVFFKAQKVIKTKPVRVHVTDLVPYLRNFFGIITVDITPPTTLYHPLIQEYDTEKKKVIGTLLPLIQTTIPSNILHEALAIGYVVTKIYRADRYKSTVSYWRDGFLGGMYLNKMRNAGVVPPEKHARIIEYFQTRFGIDCSDIATWEKNSVKKQIAKGPITAAWGKHAESTDHEQFKVLDSSAVDSVYFFKEIMENKHKIANIRMVAGNTMLNYKENRDTEEPDLSKGYVPASVFVTAYGRIKLWREMVKIDPLGTKNPRVLMYDTDSIVYKCNGDCSEEYHISEGDCLGQWETEDLESKNQGLVKFYAIGPKSYSIVCGNGVELLKLKGATIKHAHKNLMSPAIMKELVLSNTPGRNKKEAILPQMTFKYDIGKGMGTEYFGKKVSFQEEHVKGQFIWDEYRAYPFGYQFATSKRNAP